MGENHMGHTGVSVCSAVAASARINWKGIWLTQVDVEDVPVCVDIWLLQCWTTHFYLLFATWLCMITGTSQKVGDSPDVQWRYTSFNSLKLEL